MYRIRMYNPLVQFNKIQMDVSVLDDDNAFQEVKFSAEFLANVKISELKIFANAKLINILQNAQLPTENIVISYRIDLPNRIILQE